MKTHPTLKSMMTSHQMIVWETQTSLVKTKPIKTLNIISTHMRSTGEAKIVSKLFLRIHLISMKKMVWIKTKKKITMTNT